MAAKKEKQESTALVVIREKNPTAYDAAKAIADLAAPFGEAVEANVTYENIDSGVEVLARVREAVRTVDRLFDDAATELKQKLADLGKERDALKKRLEKADSSVATRILALYRGVPEDGQDALQKRMEGKLGSSATVSHRSVTVTVVDAAKVPDKYIKPQLSRAERVDTNAIAAAFKVDGKAIPGVTIDKNLFLTTRTSEIIS